MKAKIGILLMALAATALDAGAKGADARRPLRCVYFTAADCEPCPDRAERLCRVMRCVQDFYRREMVRNGFGSMTFALETEGASPERLKLYEVRGRKPQAEYGRSSFGAVRREVEAVLAAQGLDVKRERTIVFQRGLKWENGASQEISSYVGSWDSGCWGMCTVYDDPLLDPRNFSNKEPGGSYCGKPCSIGQFNTHYIGGIAHELGHALTLPHDGETSDERKTLGRSLMGAGNHSFGRELRGEGLGTILTAASALRLSAVSTINGGAPVSRTNDVTLLSFAHSRRDGGRLHVKGQVATGRPLRGLIVYVDPDARKNDYDALTWILKPDADGRFEETLKGVPDGAGEVRLWAVRDCNSVRLHKSRLDEARVMPAVGDEIEGFRVTAVTDVPDLGGRLWQLTYAKNGAELVWMDRPDDNLTFAVAFKTIPEDDTGIAHIMEHSVLCGSAKYHLKEPFVDLSKSSLATYLNAYTSADRAVYPIASRNRQDYLNLADVYLDAVFHPLSVTSEWQLRQEGWRYEDDGTNLTRNGVVYSEMKGVYGNPFAVAGLELRRLLYPDNTYGKSSGGDPVHIPELTHAQYRRFHDRFYHPCNALVFLDGKVDLKATLALVGSYLKDFSRRTVDRTVPLQKSVRGARTREYACENETDRTIVMDGRVYGTHEDRARELAMDVACRYLAGSNEAPLKKAVLGSKLCQDFDVYTSGYEQMALYTLARNVVTGRADELRALVRETVTRLCREGFDRTRLAAILDRMEFVAREQDSDQRGLKNLSAVLDSWLYGGHPAAKLGYREVFAQVRSRLGTDWFERLFKAAFDSSHCGEVTLVPSATVAERRRQEERRELAAIRAKMSSEELRKIGEMSRWLRHHQTAPDSAEEIAKLPRLSLRDLPAHGVVPAWSVSDVGGTALVRPQVALDGIVYLDLCFSLKGLSDEELADVPLLAEMLGKLATVRRSALEVKSELDGKLGGFWLSPESYVSGPQLTVHFSALDSRADDVVRLAEEILLGTRFDDKEAVACLRAQEREDLEQSMSSSGRGYTATRAQRSLSERSRIADLFGGIGQLRRLQGAKMSDWATLARKVFVRNRLTVCLTGGLGDGFVKRTVGIFPQADVGASASAASVVGPTSEGFVTDATVGYLTMANRLPADVPFHGSQLVAAKIISMENLWIEVRMKGGAYGGRLEISPLGDVTCSSWRDPNPKRTLGICSSVADALTDFLDSGMSFERYQVAMTRACEPNLSPRGLSSFARQMYFNGRTAESLQQTRREILGTTAADLRKFAVTLRELMAGASTCVFANGKLLDGCALKKVEGVRLPVVSDRVRLLHAGP